MALDAAPSTDGPASPQPASALRRNRASTTGRRPTSIDPGSTVRATAGHRSAPHGLAAVDDELLRRLVGNGDAAASFAISIDGEIVHTAALGVRSLADSDVVEPTDRFRIASISKTISAITTLQLVEDGVVGLDDPVGGIIAESLGVGGGTRRNGRHHRAATARPHVRVRPVREPLLRAPGGFVPRCGDGGVHRDLQGVPGLGFRYSNMNYCVLGLLIASLTGVSYEQAVYERLLTPLGISGMRLAPTYDPGPDEVDHRTVIGRNYMEVLEGAGAWVATPSDLVTIIDSLDLTKPGWKPLDAATLTVMQTSINDPLVPDRGYGLGLILYGGGAYGHTGTVESTHAMVLDRNDGVSWALTVSGDHPSESGDLAGIVDDALVAGGFVSGASVVAE